MLTSNINHHQLQYELVNGSGVTTSNIYKSSSAAVFIFTYFRSMKTCKEKPSN